MISAWLLVAAVVMASYARGVQEGADCMPFAAAVVLSFLWPLSMPYGFYLLMRSRGGR